MLQIGDSAPFFEAESTQGTIKLGELIGKHPVVLIFYPMDETPGCTAQLCAVRDSKKQYESIDAVVIGVNPAGIDAHRKFATNHGLDFPIAVDEGGAIRKKYEVGKMLGLFLQQRIVYGIDKQGKIAFARKGSPPAEEIVAALSRA